MDIDEIGRCLFTKNEMYFVFGIDDGCTSFREARPSTMNPRYAGEFLNELSRKNFVETEKKEEERGKHIKITPREELEVLRSMIKTLVKIRSDDYDGDIESVLKDIEKNLEVI